jgi:hypothetical protein
VLLEVARGSFRPDTRRPGNDTRGAGRSEVEGAPGKESGVRQANDCVARTAHSKGHANQHVLRLSGPRGSRRRRRFLAARPHARDRPAPLTTSRRPPFSSSAPLPRASQLECRCPMSAGAYRVSAQGSPTPALGQVTSAHGQVTSARWQVTSAHGWPRRPTGQPEPERGEAALASPRSGAARRRWTLARAWASTPRIGPPTRIRLVRSGVPKAALPINVLTAPREWRNWQTHQT